MVQMATEAGFSIIMTCLSPRRQIHSAFFRLILTTSFMAFFVESEILYANDASAAFTSFDIKGGRFCNEFFVRSVSFLRKRCVGISGDRVHTEVLRNYRAEARRHHFHRFRVYESIEQSGYERPQDLGGKIDILKENDKMDWMLRFSGVGRLFSNQKVRSLPRTQTNGTNEERNRSQIVPDHIIFLDRLSSSTVAVIGLGGVGSWAAEALCRSGIGNLILIDLDDICISNTNRQLHALSSTVGKIKIQEMKARLIDINPQCNVTLIHDFISKDNAHGLIQSLLPQLTACVDAIDGMYEKTALIVACVDHSVPIVTCGGAAGRSDPTQIVIGDLTQVQEDRLLFRCRKEMRQAHGFPKGPSSTVRNKKGRAKKWRIPAVYSTEVQLSTNSMENESSLRRCDGALGTACFVTGSYGFVAASKIVEMISTDSLIIPKKRSKMR